MFIVRIFFFFQWFQYNNNPNDVRTSSVRKSLTSIFTLTPPNRIRMDNAVFRRPNFQPNNKTLFRVLATRRSRIQSPRAIDCSQMFDRHWFFRQTPPSRFGEIFNKKKSNFKFDGLAVALKLYTYRRISFDPLISSRFWISYRNFEVKVV